MISFHNPEFHEKIMRKYGRRIWKSYFPNLFFKQDFRSSGQRKLNVFVRVKFDIHKIKSLKNYLLSPPKEKTCETSFFPLKLKIFGLTSFKQGNEKNISLKPGHGKDETQNLTYRFTFPESPYGDFKFQEQVTSGSMSFSFAPFSLINQKLVVSNLQPQNLKFLNLDSSEFRDLNYFSANFTLPIIKILKLNILKLNSLKKSRRVFISRILNRARILQNSENSFLKESNLFFTQSRLPVGRETSVSTPKSIPYFLEKSVIFGSIQKSSIMNLLRNHSTSTQEPEFFTRSPAYPLIPFRRTSSLIREDFNETLSKSEELKHSGGNLSGRDALTRSSTGIKDSRNSKVLLVNLSKSFNPTSLSKSFNLVPLSKFINLKTLSKSFNLVPLSKFFSSTTITRSFNPTILTRFLYFGSLEQKRKTRKKKVENNQRKQNSGVEQSKEEIWEKEPILTTKEKQNIIETKEKQHIHESNWLTAVKEGIEIISQLNQQVLFTASHTESYQLKREEKKLNSGSTAAFQLNNKEKNRSENAVFSPPFRVTIQQTCTTSNYEKIRSMFYIFKYTKNLKLTSEFTRITRILRADYQQFNHNISDNVIDYNLNFFNSHIDDVFNYNFFDFRIAEYTPDYRLPDPYADFNYIPYGRKIDNKRVQDWKKHNPIQINRMKNRLDKHLFFKPTKITAHRLIRAKATSFSCENTFQKARFAAEFLIHSLSPIPSENNLPHRIHNKLFRKKKQVDIFPKGLRSSLPTKGFRSSLFPKGLRSSLFTKYLLIRNPLLASNNNIFRADISSYGSTGLSGDYRINRSMSHEISMLHRISERSFFAGLTNIFHQYPETIYEARTRNFEKTFVPSIVEINKKLQLALKLSSYQNQRSRVSENTVIRIFNCLMILTRNLAHNLVYNLARNISTGFQQNEQQFQPDRLKIVPGGRTASSFNWKQTPESEGVFLASDYQVGIKPASSQFFSRFKIHRSLLARNKLGNTTGTFGTTDGTYMTGSQANPVQERKFDSRFAWIQKIFDFSEVPLPFSRTTVKGENPAYPQKISVLRGSSLREPDNIVTYTPDQPLIQLHSLNRARIFKDRAVLKSNLIEKCIFNSSAVHTTDIKDVYSNLQHAFHAFNYTGARTFSKRDRSPKERNLPGKGISTLNPSRIGNYLNDGYLLFDSDRTTYYSTKVAHYSTKVAHYLTKIVHYLTSNQKAEYTREKKREHEYYWPITEIEKLQNKFAWPVFLKSLDTIIYRFGKPEILPSSRTQNIASSGAKTPIFGLREVENPRKNHIIQNVSVYTETYPVTWTLNSPASSKQSYPSFFKSFSVLPGKETLEYSRILDPASGTNTPVTTENRSILNKIQNLILTNSLSSNIFLSGMPSTSASILSLSKTIGIASGKTIPVYNLLKYVYSFKSAYSLKPTHSLKYASPIISKNPLFAEKFGVPSNTETENSNAESLRNKPSLRYKPASISQLSRAQKPDGQKVSHWKTARMKLRPEGGKRKSDTGNFLQRISLDSLERKNNKLRVSKNIDIPAEAQMRQRLFSDSILSSKYDIIKGMKQEKITSTTYKPEKNPEKMQDTFNGFLFRSKILKVSILKSSEKTASPRIHLGPESTNFVFSRADGAGKPSEFTAFEPSVKGRSKLKYAKGSNRKTEREDLVYGTSGTLLEEVKKVKKIIFETRKIVADHLESHSPQVTGTAEEGMDIEYISEKIMQAINHRLKIEAERRGIF